MPKHLDDKSHAELLRRLVQWFDNYDLPMDEDPSWKALVELVRAAASTPSHALENAQEDCPHGTIRYGGTGKGPCHLCEVDRLASVASTTACSGELLIRLRNIARSRRNLKFAITEQETRIDLKGDLQMATRRAKQNLDDDIFALIDADFDLDAALETTPSATARIVTEEMVNRFLSWPLPKDFGPDCGISFSPPKTPHPIGYWPIGTNLLTATQARAMLEHVLATTDGGKQT